LPGNIYDVDILQTGALYRVDVDVPVYVNSIDVSPIYTTLNILPSGSLRVDTPLDITGASLVIDGGELSNTVINGSGVLRATSANATPTLDNVTLGTDLRLDTGQNVIRVSNGLTLDQSDIRVAKQGTINYDAGVTIGGTGRVLLEYNYTDTNSFSLQNELAGNLTIGLGVEYFAESGQLGFYGNAAHLINEGTIRAGNSRISQARISIATDVFTNNGVLIAGNASSVTLGGEWSNTNGSIILDGGTVNLTGTYAFSGLGDIQWTNADYSYLRFMGQFDHEGQDLVFDDSTGDIGFEATMQGGRIISNKSDYMLLGGNLENTSLRGQFDSLVDFTSQLTLENGARLLGTGSVILKSSGVATLAGVGEIVFGDNGTAPVSSIHTSGGTLTFGPGITIRTGDGSGSIGEASSLNNDMWINQGTILVETPGQDIDFRGHWHNDGLIRVTDGRLLLNGVWDLSDLGTIEQTGGIIKIINYDNTGETFLLDQANDRWAHEGIFTGGRIEAVNGAVFQFDNSHVNNTTLSGAFDAQYLFLTGSTLDNAAISLQRTEQGSGDPRIRIEDGVLAGTGQITFDAPDHEVEVANPINDQLLIEPGITIQTGLGSGYIQADMTNQGTLVAKTADTYLHLEGQWTNQGVLVVEDGDLYLDGELQPQDIGTIQRTGSGHVYLIGDIDMSSSPLDLAVFGSDIEIHAGARLHGGVLASSTDIPLKLATLSLNYRKIDPGDYVFFEDMTFDSDLQVLTNRRVYFDGVITLNAGRVIRLGAGASPPPGSVEASLYFESGSSLVGDGSLVFDANSNGNPSLVRMDEFGENVTVLSGTGDGRILRASGVSVGTLRGTILADQPDRWIEVSGTFDHYGTSSASNDGLLKLISGNWNNLAGATLEAVTGGEVEVRSDIFNGGLIHADGGLVRFVSSELTNQATGSVVATNLGEVTINDNTVNEGSVLAENGGLFQHGAGTFTNTATGVVTAGPGGKVELTSLTANNGVFHVDGGELRLGASSGSMSAATLGTINRNGGELVFVKGFDNEGMTLDMDGPFGQITLDGSSARITGGDIVGTQGTPLLVIDGELSEATITTDIHIIGELGLTRAATLSGLELIDASDPGGQPATVTIFGGGVFFQDVHVGVSINVGNSSSFEQLWVDPQTTFAPGSEINVGYNDIVRFDSPRILSDMTITLTSTQSAIESEGGPLVIGPTATIRVNGGARQEMVSEEGDLINHGTITANAGELDIEANQFINYGILEVLGANAEVYLKPGWINYGTFRIGDGDLFLSGVINRDDLGYIERTGGGHITLSYVYDNVGQVLDLDGTLGDVRLDGSLYGGTITSSVGNVMFTGDGDCCRLTTNKLYGVTLATDFDIRRETDEVHFYNGLTLDDADVYLRDGKLLIGAGISGTGRIILYSANSSNDDGTLTGELNIAPGISIVAGSYGRIGQRSPSNRTINLVSHGQVIADGENKRIYIDTLTFDNYGAVRALNGGRIEVDIAQWQNQGEVQLDDGTIMFTTVEFFNEITNLAGASIHGHGLIDLTADSPLFNLRGTLVNEGTVSPGTLVGGLEVVGSYRQESAGVMAVVLHDGLAGAAETPLTVSDSVMLGGTLEAALDTGFVPQIGDVFPVVAAASVEGYFSNLVLPTLAPGSMWVMGYGSTDVTLSLMLAGDLDGDGFVGIADLNAVLQGWNQSVDPWDLSLGDVTGDGFVGIADLTVVLGNWNAATPPVVTTQIPEPTTMVLLLVGLGLSRRP
jgi:hypothetical protein